MLKRTIALFFALAVTVCAQFPYHDNTGAFNATTNATGSYDAFSWNWMGYDDQTITVTLLPSGSTAVAFRMCYPKRGTIFVSSLDGTLTGGTNYTLSIARTNLPPDGIYFAEFLGYVGSVTTVPARVLATGQINVQHSLFQNTTQSTWTNPLAGTVIGPPLHTLSTLTNWPFLSTNMIGSGLAMVDGMLVTTGEAVSAVAFVAITGEPTDNAALAAWGAGLGGTDSVARAGVEINSNNLSVLQAVALTNGALYATAAQGALADKALTNAAAFDAAGSAAAVSNAAFGQGWITSESDTLESVLLRNNVSTNTPIKVLSTPDADPLSGWLRIVQSGTAAYMQGSSPDPVVHAQNVGAGPSVRAIGDAGANIDLGYHDYAIFVAGGKVNLGSNVEGVATNSAGADAGATAVQRTGDVGPINLTNATVSVRNPVNGTDAANADWVRSLLSGGTYLYTSTNINAANTNFFQFRTDLNAVNATRTYTAPAAAEYIGTVMSTQQYFSLVSPITVSTYLGASANTITVHPELYYTYDGTNLLGDWDSAGQSVGAGSNLYQWVISFPTVTATNTTGFYVVRRLKVDANDNNRNLTVHIGGSTPSHVSFSTAPTTDLGTRGATGGSINGATGTYDSVARFLSLTLDGAGIAAAGGVTNGGATVNGSAVTNGAVITIAGSGTLTNINVGGIVGTVVDGVASVAGVATNIAGANAGATATQPGYFSTWVVWTNSAINGTNSFSATSNGTNYHLRLW